MLCNKLPQTQWLKKMPVRYLTVSGQMSRHGVMGFSAQGLTAEVKGCIPTRRLWGKSHLQAHSGCCLNSVPHCCRIEVTISQLPVHWGGSLSTSRDHPHSLPCGHLHLQSQPQTASLTSNPSPASNFICQKEPSPPPQGLN